MARWQKLVRSLVGKKAIMAVTGLLFLFVVAHLLGNLKVFEGPAKFDAYGQGGIHYVWPYWSDARGYQTEAEWDRFAVVSDESYDNSSLDGDLRPRGGTVASDAAAVVKGVFTDFFGRTRPTGGGWSAGAVQTS